MKLEDIKKFKVPELKFRLKELGLDCRGLKAELVDRLWSAVQASGHESSAPSDTTTPPHHVSTQGEAEYSLIQSHREYADTATQTDVELLGFGVIPETGQGLGSEKGTLKKQQGDKDLSAEQGMALKIQEMVKGRAFYEFKEEIRYKRAKLPQIPVREQLVDEDPNIVTIDSYNSHIHFEVESDGASGLPRFWERFPLLWSGCRLSHGVWQNRVGFEVRLERKLLTPQPPERKDMLELETFGLRVGWSVANTSLLLGEDHLSFAYDGRGKKVSQGKEEDYGEPFFVGDIIGCYASFSSDGAVELSFYKNGFLMDVAFSLDGSVLQGQPLFPHVLCRSCSVRFLLDPTAPPWYPSPPGFTPLIALPNEQKISAVSAPRSISHCEMILMVGLPGSGKTHWAKNHINQHPEKHYRLLGTEELLACMITGGQRDSKLQQASQCLTELIKLAAKIPGNYILDQCNILFSARHYKLQLFEGFRRNVKVIFPLKDEWKRRLIKHQITEQIPQTALLKLQVSCTLPEQDNFLEELQYVEQSQQQALTILQEYKDEARRLLPPVPKHDKKQAHPYKKRPYTLRTLSSHKTQYTGWNHLRLWSQPQTYWSASYLQGHNYDGQDLSSCNYEGYW